MNVICEFSEFWVYNTIQLFLMMNLISSCNDSVMQDIEFHMRYYLFPVACFYRYVLCKRLHCDSLKCLIQILKELV